MGGEVAQPKAQTAYDLESAVDQAIALCYSDVRAALRATLVANSVRS
jgi:hypothetical protein